ncbi:bifunctional uridylate/adenylate kinase [Lodderomyces elongisporus]|uniref:Uridylate kinase n=1 Tax=Lodderomyces elongisporus (strain ATCC 11503 / CBS 2605 / JCM 1781 / NBRC 1676 / NRRL YB-4239) TaxID=379508 RepID=A5DWT2_LODEL|nr:bifunctional uridylate/adenylate kinase [Lodderomyces elongisporus]EDK43640.1 uridylate kinase [Lodderomyces elongisporus NRRL YB-4239]WLF78067.1 bifunctional uridylate/adenylate kinase [Lodderomyces elongisporus]
MFSRPSIVAKRLLWNLSRPTANKNAGLRLIRKFSTTPPPPNSDPRIRGKIILVMGALALGSTIAVYTFKKDEPKSAFEPEQKTISTPAPAPAPAQAQAPVAQSVAAPEFAPGKISVIFVLGGPGSGKGTQCEKLVREKNFVHLSAGDLLRAEQNRPGSTYGELISQCIKEGTIVPQEVTVQLLKNAVKENYEKGQTKFLIDGFPRKMDQAITFEDTIAKSSFTLFFECPEAVMLKRLLERGKTSGRADDNVESIKKRFRTFIDTSMPVVDYFAEQGKVVTVNCDHPIDTVSAQVLEALKSRGI